MLLGSIKSPVWLDCHVCWLKHVKTNVFMPDSQMATSENHRVVRCAAKEPPTTEPSPSSEPTLPNCTSPSNNGEHDGHGGLGSSNKPKSMFRENYSCICQTMAANIVWSFKYVEVIHGYWWRCLQWWAPTGYDWHPGSRGASCESCGSELKCTRKSLMLAGFLPILVDLSMKGYIVIYIYIYTVIVCNSYMYIMYIHNSIYI